MYDRIEYEQVSVCTDEVDLPVKKYNIKNKIIGQNIFIVITGGRTEICRSHEPGGGGELLVVLGVEHNRRGARQTRQESVDEGQVAGDVDVRVVESNLQTCDAS